MGTQLTNMGILAAVTVVNGIDMHIKKGDIYGFIGKNGAGKTTLMKMICGLISQTSGNYSLFGMKNADEARKKIGSLIENPALFPHMTVKENLTYYAKLKNASEKKVDELLELVGLQSNAMNKKKYNIEETGRNSVIVRTIFSLYEGKNW